MTFRELQQQVGAWSRHNFPNNKPHHPLLGVSEECGELCHAHLKMEQGIRGTAEEHLEAKADAVGDILIYLADYCERNDLLMEYCVSVAWNQVKDRDWQRFPKNGRSE